MNWKKTLFLGCTAALLLQSCGGERREVPDVSHISANVKIERFEQDLFRLDTTNMTASLAQLETRYPGFSQVFFRQVLRSKNPAIASEGHEAYVKGFINFPPVRHLFDTCSTVFANMDDVAAQFDQAFRLFKYYLPERRTPDTITTFLSEYSYAGFLYGENSLAIGLDLFLGAYFPYARYNPGQEAFSSYLVRTYTRDHIVSKSMQLLIDDLLGTPSGNRMLDAMMFNGKKLYLLDLTLPNTPDSIKLEITAAQTDWLRDNELEMWAFFLDEKLLYSSEWKDIRKYIDYSPNSPGMPEGAPGRTANWVGWQIVKAYMELHPETTPEQLIAMKDAQVLLEKSRYKPKR
ncbi:MAG: hypothetical protein ACKV1O_05760 [Saprospiraceae bacterium]